MRTHSKECTGKPCSCGVHAALQVEFQELAKPLIKFLCEEWHPHTMILITPTGAELVSGEMAFQTEEFLVD